MKKLLTIAIAIIAVLDIALLVSLFISLGVGFGFTILGYSLAVDVPLLLLSFGCYFLAKKKWTIAYIPSVVILILALVFEIVITTMNVFPGLSGLVPTMIVLVGVNASVICLVVVHTLAWKKIKPKILS